MPVFTAVEYDQVKWNMVILMAGTESTEARWSWYGTVVQIDESLVTKQKTKTRHS